MPRSGSLVPSLAAHGMRVAFGLPGAHTVPLYGARARRVRHEQSATFMALTTTGPGLPHAATGPTTGRQETGSVVMPRRACCPWAPPTRSLPPSTTG
jgi:thiamine pyrophosphate-dependent acetolactate synthase large subunit-like protein